MPFLIPAVLYCIIVYKLWYGDCLFMLLHIILAKAILHWVLFSISFSPPLSTTAHTFSSTQLDVILRDNHYVRKFCCAGPAKALSEQFLIKCTLPHLSTVDSQWTVAKDFFLNLGSTDITFLLSTGRVIVFFF